jgi:predicted porin
MMKLVLPAALTMVMGAASAQSSITLFGVVDATLQRGTGGIAGRTQLGSNGLATGRLGFRGVEDLGGGLSASFWLEAQSNVDSGTGATTNTNNQANGTAPALAGGQGLTFNRRSTVSLSGAWGEVRFGRDFSVQYYNRFVFDPFGNNGVGTSQTQVGSLGGPVGARVSNALMYLLPANVGGLYGEVQYYLGENASNVGVTAHDGDGGGLRIGWNRSGLNMAFAYARTQYARTASTGDITAVNVGAQYDIAALSVMGGYFRDHVNTLDGVTGRGPQVGGIWRVGSGEVKAQWSQYKTSALGSPQSSKLSLGYVHNLSKRTALYATYARVRNSGGAATALNGALTGPDQSSSGLDLGLRHSF